LESKKNVLKFLVTRVLPLSISVGILIYFCVSGHNLETLIKVFPKLNIFYLLLAIVAMFGYWVFDSLVFKELLEKGTFSSFFGYFKLTMIGQYYNSITPFNSGGQPAQVLALSKKNISAGKSISKLSQKFFIFQLCTIFLSSLSIIFYSDTFKRKIVGFTFFSTLGLIVQISSMLLIILLYILKNKMIHVIFFMCNLLKKLKIIKNSEKLKDKIVGQLTFLMENNFSINCGVLVYVYSFLQNICINSIPFFVAKAFGCPGFPFLKMISAQIFITLISSINPLPGAAGSTENGFIKILSDFFIKSNIAAAMILFRLINYYLVIVLGFIIMQFTKISSD
jgi:uncharacterized protein (TIRG00374 family)